MSAQIMIAAGGTTGAHSKFAVSVGYRSHANSIAKLSLD
jgi:hypothetical protein